MTATVVVAPEVRGLGPVRDPVTQVAGAALLPFVYGTWWFGNVTRQLREFGSDGRDARLSVVSPAWAWSGMALGWILVVPAVVVMVGTARRVQHAEELASVGRQSIGGVIAAVVGGQALGIVAVVGGSAILAPFALLASAVLVVAMLQPRLNRIWKRSAGWPARDREPAPDAIPFVPPAWSRRWGGMAEDVREFLGFSLVAVALTCAAAAVSFLASFLAAEDRTGLLGGFVTALSLVALLVGVSFAVGSLLRLAAGGRFALDRAVVGAALLSAVAAVAWLWTVRPLFHGVLMSLYQWPLVTWLPLVAGLAFTTLLAAVGNARAGIAWRVPVTLLVWGVFMLLLPGWQAQALYAATAYVPTDLPRTTQPRLLPKVAALAFGSDARLHDAHLVVDPSSHRLVWSAERAGGWPRRGPSQRVVALPLDRVDGTIHDVADGFDRAVSRVGPASLQWRAYDRHFLTRVQDAVLVPGVDGEAVAVAPYVRYAGFPVRHPVWAGVYVYHQDGRMEDLTPEQALARPELAHSGRLYPERLARAVADADPRTEIDDPPGNPQPYLTNLGDNEERWVTVGHPAFDDDTASAVYLTDAANGRTSIWTPPHGTRLLSNQGAVAVTKRLPIEWDRVDSKGEITWLRKVAEPTPVFARGRLYYLVSIVPNHDYVHTPRPVEETVVVDAARRRIVKRFDNADPEASAALLAFFNP